MGNARPEVARSFIEMAILLLQASLHLYWQQHISFQAETFGNCIQLLNTDLFASMMGAYDILSMHLTVKSQALCSLLPGFSAAGFPAEVPSRHLALTK